ncbi:MAG TPA: 50S ribosomal protein L25/general stress protein Ctc [Bacteroidia bacterium]|nr:50S ribosomal protein L25/general stress protein Ctc [Bacteroidia bacterium]
MKSVAISGSLRSNVGKKDAKGLRTSGMVPCVLYGGTEQVKFAVEERAFKPLVYTPDVHIVELDLGGKKHNAIMKELQLHPVTDKILHVDFLEVVPGKAVTMELPVRFEGTAPGVRNGGKLLRKMRKIAVRGPVEKMPDALTIDVSKMEIGDTVRVGDVKIDGLTLLDKPNITIVAVRVTRNVVEEEVAKPVTTAAATPAAGAPAAGAPAAADDKKKPAEKKK